MKPKIIGGKPNPLSDPEFKANYEKMKAQDQQIQRQMKPKIIGGKPNPLSDPEFKANYEKIKAKDQQIQRQNKNQYIRGSLKETHLHHIIKK